MAIPWNKGLKGWSKGEQNGNWKGGITPRHLLIRSSTDYQVWRKNIYKRDKWTCQICEDTKNIRANHIKKFADFPNLRMNMNNGITICKKCDLSLVLGHEPSWESYFNFNLMVRGYLLWQ